VILATADEFACAEDALAFLESKEVGGAKIFARQPEPRDLLSLRCVALWTRLGDFEQALKGLQEVEARLSEASAHAVRSAFYAAQTGLDKARGDYDAFYAHAFLFLSTAGVAADAALAYDLCVAALLADNVCSFGELAAHPIIGSLDGAHAWLRDLIALLDRGDARSIDEFNGSFAPRLRASEVFAPFFAKVQRKLAIAVLLEVIFQRPFDSRVFAFDEIAAVCHIEKDEVELLVLKALATDIIRGTVDEVEEKVTVTWCKPKALAADRLRHLKSEIDRWIEVVHAQKVNLKARAQAVVGP
jgi:26S proteasome regulatory subunit N9